MVQQIKEEPDVKEFIKQETLFKKHPEPFGPEFHNTVIAATASFSSYYNNVTSKVTYSLSDLQYPLIVADAIGYGECDFNIFSGRHNCKSSKSD
jgi:hypothetical protein